jgi:hypothetical protein
MGWAFTPKDFLEVAGYESARKSLQRLANAGKIRRLLRGVYDYPEDSAILGRPAPPAPDAIALALARAHAWTILPAGDTALNLLGLSTQLPARWEYFSDGPTRRYAWEGGTLVFKHRANRETTRLSPRTALVAQALKTLGQARISEDLLSALGEKLEADDWARAARETRYATAWVHEIIQRLADKKGTGNA